MSIIYSYPESQPTLQDLLIGTDVADENATKSFSVQSLVSLINASQNNGIITDVTISTSDVFLTAVKTSGIGDPAIAYTLGLTSLPTIGQENTQFLRGDNQWVVPTVTSGINVSDESSIITTGDPLASLNFTGEGVDATSDALGNVQVSIQGATSAVEEVLAGGGIAVSSPTGNVTISNTGILSITEGQGITATTEEGVTTISATSSASGTVTSITPGTGLALEGESTSTTAPIIGINYSGNENFIVSGIDQTPPIATDQILFNQPSPSNLVKSTELGKIPLTALTTVNTAITESVANVLKNDTDVSPFLEAVPKVNKVVTLTDAQYQTLIASSPLPADFANTLYLTTAAGAPPLPQFTLTNSISDTIQNPLGAAYTVTSTVANGASRIRAAGDQESWSTSVSIADTSSYYFSSLNIAPASPQSVTYDADKTISTSISGTIAAVQPNQCTAYLGGEDPNSAGNGIGATIVGKLVGGEEGIDYVITYSNPTNSLTGACTDPLTPSQSNFGVNYALIGPGDPGYVPGRGSDGYAIISGPTYSYSGPSTYNGTPTCNIGGQRVVKQYFVRYSIDNQIDGDGSLMGTNYNLQNGPVPWSQTNTLTENYNPARWGNSYSVGTDVNPLGTNAVSNIVKTPTGPDSGLWDPQLELFVVSSLTKDYDFGLTITGTSGTSSFLVTAGTQTVNIGSNAGAQLQYSINGGVSFIDYVDPFSVPANTQVQFAYTVLPDNGYFFFEAPVLTQGGTVVNGTNLGITRTIFDTFIPTADVTRADVNITATTNANYLPILVSAGGQQGNQCAAAVGNRVYIKKGPGNTAAFYIQAGDFLYADSNSAIPIPNDYYSGLDVTPQKVEFYVYPSGLVGALSACPQGPNEL